MSEKSPSAIVLIAEPDELQSLSKHRGLYKFFLSELPPEQLYKALCAINDGTLLIEQSLPASTAYALSQRDCQVLKMIAAGATNREIAERLYLSVSTIKLIIRRLMDMFQAGDRTQAAVFATKHGLI